MGQREGTSQSGTLSCSSVPVPQEVASSYRRTGDCYTFRHGNAGSADYINVLDTKNGEVLRRVHFSNRSHDTLVSLSRPNFQETKAVTEAADVFI
jgi:hypothetical protein